MKKPKTQQQAIIHLLIKGWVNPLEALQKVGTMKLGTRISEIKDDFPIERRYNYGTSRFGFKSQWMEYRIKPKSNVEKSLKKYGLG